MLVLGAGGAARGILQPLLDAHAAAITISNRTTAKAEALAREFAAWGPIRAVAPHDLVNVASEAHHVADVVINATSSGLADRPLGAPPWPASIFAPTRVRLRPGLRAGRRADAVPASSRARAGSRARPTASAC